MTLSWQQGPQSVIRKHPQTIIPLSVLTTVRRQVGSQDSCGEYQSLPNLHVTTEIKIHLTKQHYYQSLIVQLLEVWSNFGLVFLFLNYPSGTC